MTTSALDVRERVAVVESRLDEHDEKLSVVEEIQRTIHEWRGGFRVLGGAVIVVQLATAALTLYMQKH